MIKRLAKFILDNILCKNRIFKKYYKDWKILSSSKIGTLVINFIFQRIFRINGRCKYPIHFTSRITNPDNFIIRGTGKRTVFCMAVNGGCYFQAANDIIIEEGVLIAPGVKIISGNHDIFNLDKPATVDNPIHIGANVWIGANAVILPGVNIAADCIIGAGSIVTKSFHESGLIIAGNPARVIGKKSEEGMVKQ